jgi:CDP-paratose 2-epimerase
VDVFGLRAVIDRCGVISGPWQMGRSEQGVFAHWMIAHAFRRPLAYIGFGGRGHQVRDVLHVDDLAALVDRQIERAAELAGEVFNVGGGLENSASLAEFTRLCAELTGAKIPIEARLQTRAGDVPLYVTDASRVRQKFAWAPERSVDRLARDLHEWASAHRRLLETALA